MVELRQVGNDFPDVPDQLGHVGRLLGGAVDFQCDGALVDDLALHRHDLGADRTFFDVLAQVPGAALVAGDQLQVAARHVQTGRVAVDDLVCLVGADAETGLAHGQHQFHFKVVVVRAGRVGHGRAALHQGLRRLGEVERALGRLVDRLAHLDGVRVVVAADAEDAVDGETFGLAPDGQGLDGGRGEEVWGHVDRNRRSSVKGSSREHRGTGFAGPLVLPPWKGGDGRSPARGVSVFHTHRACGAAGIRRR
ncbi:hypothetical protein Y695_03395 [Hydrogenophaga sp. T4]|nr:hypothetical protein Y695_03395 [Hydrogenophaga sp. T4]